MEETSPASACLHTVFTLLHSFNDFADESGKQEMQKLCMVEYIIKFWRRTTSMQLGPVARRKTALH